MQESPPSQPYKLGEGVPQSIICETAYKNSSNLYLIMAHAIIIVVLITLLVWMIQFIRRMSLFPVKERAPKLALLQSIMFFLIIVTTYSAEFLIPQWKSASNTEIPYSRRIFKGIYFSLRFFCYFIFGLR